VYSRKHPSTLLCAALQAPSAVVDAGLRADPLARGVTPRRANHIHPRERHPALPLRPLFCFWKASIPSCEMSIKDSYFLKREGKIDHSCQSYQTRPVFSARLAHSVKEDRALLRAILHQCSDFVAVQRDFVDMRLRPAPARRFARRHERAHAQIAIEPVVEKASDRSLCCV